MLQQQQQQRHGWFRFICLCLHRVAFDVEDKMHWSHARWPPDPPSLRPAVKSHATDSCPWIIEALLPRPSAYEAAFCVILARSFHNNLTETVYGYYRQRSLLTYISWRRMQTWNWTCCQSCKRCEVFQETSARTKNYAVEKYRNFSFFFNIWQNTVSCLF